MTSEGGLLVAEVKNEEDFYFQMRRSVAILKVTLKNGTLLYSGGVFVDGDQNVITCNQNIPEDYKEILIRSVEGCFQVAELVKRYIGSDLAIIKYANELDEEEKAKIKVVEFAGVTVVGMEVYAISHAGKLAYNFTVGQVAYPAGDADDDYRCRLAGNYSELEEIGVDKYTDLIQLNNTHMDDSQCSIGCPVFNASGQLIGLKCLKMFGFDFCYHAKDVKEIVEKHRT